MVCMIQNVLKQLFTLKTLLVILNLQSSPNRIINILLTYLILSIPSAYSKHLIIRVSESPPSYYKNSNGEWEGIQVDIFKALMKEAQIDFDFIDLPWARALKSIKDGKIDLMSVLTKTPERQKYIDFIGVSYYEQMILVVKNNNLSLKIKTIEDVFKMDKKIGVLTKAHYPIITDLINKDSSYKKYFIEVTSYHLNAAMTRKGRILGFFDNKPSALWKIKNSSQFPDYNGLAVHDFSLTSPYNLYVGASFKLDKETRFKLRNILKKMNDNGLIAKTINKWLH